MRKTKEELIKDLEAVSKERDAAVAHAKAAEEKLATLKADVKTAEKNEQMYNEMYEAAVSLKTTVDAFMDAGFDEGQAFEIMLNMMISCLPKQAPSVLDILCR